MTEVQIRNDDETITVANATVRRASLPLETLTTELARSSAHGHRSSSWAGCGHSRTGEPIVG
jgi:hypothetical protein